jgi:hypothetical protein
VIVGLGLGNVTALLQVRRIAVKIGNVAVGERPAAGKYNIVFTGRKPLDIQGIALTAVINGIRFGKNKPGLSGKTPLQK